MSDSADRYRTFARIEAAGSSPTYERLCDAIADDLVITGRLDALPSRLRQPNLLLASAQFLGSPLDETAATMEWLHQRWDEVADAMAAHATQTNEAARTGSLLPALGSIDGPLALVEIGASAGLCLYPDRYRIDYGPLGSVGPADSPVCIEVRATGRVPVPDACPEIVTRVGIDLNPLDVRDADDMAWLEACVWPEHHERRARLRAAAAIVAADPPRMVRGDMLQVLPDVLAELSSDVTPVVIHSAALAYLDRSGRERVAATLMSSPGVRWISNEAPGVVPSIDTDLAPPPDAETKGYFVVGVDGRDAVAIADAHGRWLSWQV